MYIVSMAVNCVGELNFPDHTHCLFLQSKRDYLWIQAPGRYFPNTSFGIIKRVALMDIRTDMLLI